MDEALTLFVAVPWLWRFARAATRSWGGSHSSWSCSSRQHAQVHLRYDQRQLRQHGEHGGQSACVLLPFLPLLPLQILLINFLTDLPATTIAADRVDPEQLRRPGVWDLRAIRNFMIVFGLVSSAFDFLTFGVLRLGFAAEAELLRSAWLIESVGTELAVMLVLRSHRPFFRSRPGAALLWSSILVAVLAVALPYTAAAGLDLAPLPAPVLLALAAITAGYVMVTELGKVVFYSGWQRNREARVHGAPLPAS